MGAQLEVLHNVKCAELGAGRVGSGRGWASAYKLYTYTHAVYKLYTACGTTETPLNKHRAHNMSC